MLVVAFPRSVALPVPPAVAPAGRAWLAQYGIRDRKISGGHVLFTQREGVTRVRDQGSRNGTWLDGVRLESGKDVTLRDGGVLRLGNTLLVYRAAFAGEPEASPPLGELVAPFGLRALTAQLAAFERHAPSAVLIEGETGTGKELLARLVAERLGRCEPYSAVNAAAIASSVFESQLFGHTANAFSGAQRAEKGLVVAHEGGTVFLDEIGELSLELQAKLLRLLDSREVLPVGAERPVATDVLLIAATNRRLEQLVDEGGFRRDLWARLGMSHLELPPLRERPEDLYAIARAVAPRVGLALDPEGVEVEAVEQLLVGRWPNNVRGLMALLGRTAVADPEPGLSHWAVQQALGTSAAPAGPSPLTPSAVADALAACDGNETQAARRLGVSRGKLRRFRSKP